MLDNDDIAAGVRNSLMVATVATVARDHDRDLAALGMARGQFPRQAPVSALIGLPLVVPEIVTAVAMLLFFVLSASAWACSP